MPKKTLASDGPIAPLIRRKSALGAVILGFCLLIAGGVTMWRDVRIRQRWQPVDAQVRLSEAVTFGSPAAERYRTQMEVVYAIDGSQYSVPLSLPDTTGDKQILAEQLLRYGAGATLRVYYNPDNPEDIELDLGSAQRFYILPLSLLGAGLMSLTFFFMTVARDGKYFCSACGAGVAASHAACFNCGKKMPSRKGRMRLE